MNIELATKNQQTIHRMKIARLSVIIVLFVATLVITNLPNFHLEGFFGLSNSHTTDIIAHGSYYFVISFPLFLLLRKRKTPIGVLCLLFLLPALLEFSQTLIPGRTVSMFDMFGNYVGIGVALSICFLLQHSFSVLKKARTNSVKDI